MNSLRKIFLILTIVVLIAGIVLVVAYRHGPAQPTNNQLGGLSQPRVLSYVGHPAGYGYMVDVTLINDGPNGWVKATVEANTFSGPSGMTIITSSLRTYLKKGESGTLQFVFEYGIDASIKVNAQAVIEGGPPEMDIQTLNPTEIYASYQISGDPFPSTYEMRNKENVTFEVTFLNFTYEGTYGNGSKIYSVYINLTDVTDQPTFGSPLPSVGLAVKGSLKSYTGIETTTPYFKPMHPERATITFVIPASENPEHVSWSESEFRIHWLGIG